VAGVSRRRLATSRSGRRIERRRTRKHESGCVRHRPIYRAAQKQWAGSNCRATWSTAESGSNPVWTRICRPECTVRGAFSAIAEPLARNRRRSFPRAAIFVRHRRIYDRHALRRRPTSLSESTRTRIMTPGARQRDRIKCTVVRCRGGVFLAPSGRFQLHSVASVEWDEARNYACMPARSQVERLPLARLALTRG